jgi:hypothetical protein
MGEDYEVNVLRDSVLASGLQATRTSPATAAAHDAWLCADLDSAHGGVPWLWSRQCGRGTVLQRVRH